MKFVNNLPKFVKGLSALFLTTFSLNQEAQAGPAIHISDLVKMSEAQLDAIVGPASVDPDTGGVFWDSEKVGPSITITGVSSWFTSGGLDVVDLKKREIYTVTDPKLTTFGYGQVLTKAQYDEEVKNYADFGGFLAKKEIGYAGYNGLNISLAGFKGLENMITIDPITDKMYYSTTIMIPWVTAIKGDKDGDGKQTRTQAANAKIKEDGNSIFLEQQLQLEAGSNGQLNFQSAKISLPDFPFSVGKMEYVVLEIGKERFYMTGMFTQLGALSALQNNEKYTDGKKGDGSSVRIKGEVEIAYGSLNKLHLHAEGMKMQLGVSGAFLQEITGEVGNAANPEAPWYFEGRGLVTYPDYQKSYLGRNVHLAATEGKFGFNENGRIAMSSTAKVLSFDMSSAKFVYSPPASFYVEVRDKPMGVFLGDLDLKIHEGNFSGNIGARLGVPRGVPIIGGLTLGGVKAGVTYIKDSHFEIRGEVYVMITPEIKSVCWTDCIRGSWPHLHGCGWSGCSWHTHYWKKCWSICTPRIPAVKANVGFSYHSSRDPSFKKLAAEQVEYHEPKYSWEIPFVYWWKDPEAPGWWQFNQNWDILWAETERGGIVKQGPIGKSGPDKELDVEVANELKTAVFRVNYENENITDLNVALIMPDGKTLNLKDGPFPIGFTAQGVTGAAAHNPDGREAFFMIHNVKPGSYKLVVENHAKLGGIRGELASMTQKPKTILAIDPTSAKGGEILPGSYEISGSWEDTDSPDAQIDFMIDKNNTGNDGIHVGGGKLIDFDFNESFQFNTDHLPAVRPGWYYGVVAIDDGRNPIQYSYTKYPIWIDRDGAPAPVKSMKSRAGNNKIILEWDEPEGDFSHYNVHVSKSGDFDAMEQSVLVARGKNSAIVNGLENGQPYLVSVVTADNDYLESAMMEIHRVTPTQIPGSTKPVIISDPIESAAQGYNYVYLPLLYDADEHDPVIRNITKADGGTDDVRTPIIWSVIEGPEGMKIDSAMGAIEWTPAPDQVGVHRVTIAATENVEEPEDVPAAIINNTTTQTFEISVTPKWNLGSVDDKVYFATVPNLTAVAGTQYTYTPKISSNDEFELELLSGPHGMEFKDGTLTWDVSETSDGGFVHFRLTSNATSQELESRYFLHVSSSNNNLSVGAELVKVERVADKILLGWVGSGNTFQIQSTTSLATGQAGNTNWGNIGDPIKGNYVNFISLDSADESSVFYRIKVLD